MSNSRMWLQRSDLGSKRRSRLQALLSPHDTRGGRTRTLPVARDTGQSSTGRREAHSHRLLAPEARHGGLPRPSAAMSTCPGALHPNLWPRSSRVGGGSEENSRRCSSATAALPIQGVARQCARGAGCQVRGGFRPWRCGMGRGWGHGGPWRPSFVSCSTVQRDLLRNKAEEPPSFFFTGPARAAPPGPEAARGRCPRALRPDRRPSPAFGMVLGTLTEPEPPFSRVPPRGQIGPGGPTSGSTLLRCPWAAALGRWQLGLAQKQRR